MPKIIVNDDACIISALDNGLDNGKFCMCINHFKMRETLLYFDTFNAVNGAYQLLLALIANDCLIQEVQEHAQTK